MASKLPDGWWRAEQARALLTEVAVDRAQPNQHSWEALAQMLGPKYGIRLNGEGLRTAWRKYHNTETVTEGNITYLDKKRLPTDTDVDAFVSVMRAAQSLQDNLSTRQRHAALTIADSKPIGIAFRSDMHIGHIGVDYERLEQDQNMILACDGLYVQDDGDDKDNVLTFGHAGAHYEAQFPPGVQDSVVLRFKRKERGKTISVIKGCHDTWSERMGDVDFMQAVANEAGCPNLGDGGSLTITVGEETYTGWVRHKAPGESGLNTTNVQRRMIERHGAFDFYAVAHKHFPDTAMTPKADGLRAFIRSGTYKTLQDRYAAQQVDAQGMHGVPVLVLWPDRHHMVLLDDLADGINFLTAIRAKVNEI